MTATDPASLACPKCLHTNTMVGAAGVGRCFDCMYEWDPATEVALAPLDVGPFDMPSELEVFGPPADVPPLTTAEVDAETVDDLKRFIAALDVDGVDGMDTLIGGTARLEGGQLGTVVSFPSIDSVEVVLNDGRTEIVDFSDVERITPRALDIEPAPETASVDDYAAEVQMAITLAELIVKAGIASVEGSGADVHPVAPPVGYLPDDPDLLPVIEKAAAIAVGMLIVNLHLDVDAMLHTLDPQPAGETQEATTEVTE